MEKNSLHLDYELNLKDYREVWLDSFKKMLPNTLIFWGTAACLSLIGLIFTSEKFVFTLTTITFSAIPIYIIVISYRNYMSAAKKAFSQLTENQKKIHLTFQVNSEGFDCISGKSFSYVAWESIKAIEEKNDYFVFKTAASFFLIPKIAFRNDAELIFLRSLANTIFEAKAKLLQ